MKIDGWEAVLAEYIEASEPISFLWGESDCALWVAKYYDSVKGTTFYEECHGRYFDEESANEFLKNKGFESAASIPDAYLSPVSVDFAKRGDIILFNGALGICAGRKSYILTAEKGLFAILTASCQKAWMV